MKVFNHKKIMLTFAGCLLLIIVVSSGLFIRNYNINKNKELDKVILNNNKGDNSMFAIMIEQDDGTYSESDSNIWPTSEYRYDETKSGCIDPNGNSIDNALSYDAVNNKVTLRTRYATMCYLYFSFPPPDITISISTDGETGVLPSTIGYKNTLSCSGSDYNWNMIFQRLEFNNLPNHDITCSLDYTKDTETHTTLKSEVETKATKIDGILISATNAEYVPLSFDEYTSVTNTSTSPFVWNEESGYWTQSATTAKTTSQFSFKPAETGIYRVCYILPSSAYETSSTSYKNYIQFLLNTTYTVTASKYSNYNSGDVITECYDYGYLTTNDSVTIKGYYYDQNISFSFEKAANTQKLNDEYRYSGKQPNNWVWFNGEKWRIIGSVPVKQSDGTINNLVKIIRANTSGQLTSPNRTDYNTVNTLLNTKYYGKKDITGDSQLCPSSLCNFEVIGISDDSKDMYGRMIKDVYWNIGSENFFAYGSTLKWRSDEFLGQTDTANKVWVMNASDYSFATSDISYDKYSSLSSYENYNWLYGPLYECFFPSNWFVGPTGYLTNTTSTYDAPGYLIRPVVYLDSSVYIIDGNGSEKSPYIIGL